MPWLDIFKHDAICAAKEITEWVEIGIDCYIPRRKFQLKPHSSQWFTLSGAAAMAHHNYYFHWNCFGILVITVGESSKMGGPIMLKQLIALLRLSLSDLMTSTGFATAFLTGEVYHTSPFLMAQRS